MFILLTFITVLDLVFLFTGFLAELMAILDNLNSEFCDGYVSATTGVVRFIAIYVNRIAKLSGIYITIFMSLIQVLTLKNPRKQFWIRKTIATVFLITVTLYLLFYIGEAVTLVFYSFKMPTQECLSLAILESADYSDWIFTVLKLTNYGEIGMQLLSISLEIVFYIVLKALSGKSIDTEKYKYSVMIMRVLIFCFLFDTAPFLVQISYGLITGIAELQWTRDDVSLSYTLGHVVRSIILVFRPLLIYHTSEEYRATFKEVKTKSFWFTRNKVQDNLQI
ncbi:hypothetical protein GCK72_020755 [Caenorhabditis remanei]|uniref:G-protein coupled receptors family 1 profile domain-containing protein n=1 Tax=Caenorhabditis remanei TaxID=31234 RepID=A0A6A5GI13_CAERE|nr:hypothetical protein GCK72_020755 [Caenorhabditis remanei]KAF1754195.1 hypothetical protein GCK72_020755 [Caenorhabditis remanei]